MPEPFKIFNLKAFVRAMFVCLVSFAVCMLAGEVISQVLNAIYYTTNYTGFWRDVFVLFSSYRYFFAFFVCVAGVALFSGWILAPTFNNLGQMISQHLRLSEEGESAPVRPMPKSLRALESDLAGLGKELQLWKYAVREAEQRKDDLVVYLAHDIRTPLTSVLGYLELLREHPDLPEEQRAKFTQTAYRKAQRMQLLVEELFEVTRYNIGRLELEKTAVNPGILLRQLAEEIQPLLEDRKLHLEMILGETGAILVDPNKIARALDNVLHNAAYYTPAGGTVGIRLNRLGDDHVRIEIFNTGSDIPQEKLDRFFEKFYRGDQARQTATGGSGLGLAIAKNIIEAHGGSISAENQNQVTTFTIHL